MKTITSKQGKEYYVTDREAELLSEKWHFVDDSKVYPDGKIVKVARTEDRWHFATGSTSAIDAVILFRYFTIVNENRRAYRTRVKILEGDFEGHRRTISE